MAGPVDGIGDAQRVRGIEIRPTVGIIVDVDHAAARRDHIDMLGQGKILKAQLLCNHAHDEPHVVARRSEEHTSELQSLMRSSYAVFCLQKKKTIKTTNI